MSDYERQRGAITRIMKDPEVFAKEFYEKAGEEKPNYCDTFLDALREDHYNEYVVVSGKLYSIQSKEEDSCDDIFEAERAQDGSIKFFVQFYNGGCSLSEALEEAIERLEKSEARD